VMPKTLPPWADVFTFNGEARHLRYRLQLHSAFVSAFVVIESNTTFMGRPKSRSQLAAHLLSQEDRRRWNVDVLQMEYTRKEKEQSNPWQKEFATRRFATKVIAERFPGHRVYHSDVDEFLDPAAMQDLEVNTCLAPRLRFYYYSEHCPVNETWAGAIITRTDTPWFQKHAKRGVMLRAHGGTALAHSNHACNISEAFLGWHFSYAMTNNDMLHKLRSFSHAYYGSIRYILNQQDPAAFLDAKVRDCSDIMGRNPSKEGTPRAEESAYDGHLPPLLGWPAHPLAPRDTVVLQAMSNRSVWPHAQQQHRYSKVPVKLLGTTLFSI